MATQNNETKKEHYVPSFYLKSWEIPAYQNHIYVYDKIENEERVSNIEDVASQRYFYDIDLRDYLSKDIIQEMKSRGTIKAEKTQAIEKALSKSIETPFSLMFSDLLIKADNATPWHIQNCDCISKEQKTDISVYLAVQYVRIDHIRKDLIKSSERIYDKLINMGVPPDRAEQYRLSKKDAKIIHNKMILDGQRILHLSALFEQLTWFIGLNRTKQKFYTSDCPIVVHAHIKHSILSMNGIGSRGVEVFFPLSPDVVLIMVDSDYHKHMKPFEKRYVEITDTNNIDYYNSLIAMHADRFIVSSDRKFDLIYRTLIPKEST